MDVKQQNKQTFPQRAEASGHLIKHWQKLRPQFNLHKIVLNSEGLTVHFYIKRKMFKEETSDVY